MFLDASVILAVLLNEAERGEIEAAIRDAERLTTSPIAIFEASSRIAVLTRMGFESARAVINEFLRISRVDVVAIGPGTGELAVEIAARFHYIAKSPARLNMGDCFVAACAIESGMALAYKGNDFTQTDLNARRFG